MYADPFVFLNFTAAFSSHLINSLERLVRCFSIGYKDALSDIENIDQSRNYEQVPGRTGSGMVELGGFAPQATIIEEREKHCAFFTKP